MAGIVENWGKLHRTLAATYITAFVFLVGPRLLPDLFNLRKLNI